MSKKNTIEEIEKLFKEEDAVLNLTSTYVDRRSNTLMYTCKHGIIHTTSLVNTLLNKKYKNNIYKGLY
jgi:hypothetical protein